MNAPIGSLGRLLAQAATWAQIALLDVLAELAFVD
jgi:hypothetical protein